jgi:hypothetical protein
MQNTITQPPLTASNLKKGSIVEIRLNLNPEQMNVPVQVEIERATEFYLWFKHNGCLRIKRKTFDTLVKNFGYRIISI